MVVAQTSHGYIIAWADGTPQPGTSNINFPVSGSTSNLVIVPVGTDGIIDFYNGDAGNVQLIGDVSWPGPVPGEMRADLATASPAALAAVGPPRS